jgi:hypothetical protein
MKIRFLRRIIPFSSCFLLAVAFSYPTQAAPNKAEIDNYAKANGFPRSDYPYYENVNGCGGEGWSETAVRDSYGKVSFHEACNNHDRCYMTLGSDLNACDDNFYKDLRASCERDSYIRDPFFDTKIPDPATLSACYRIATTYYGSVRAVGWNWHNGAQKKSKEYKNLVQNFTTQSQTASLFRIRNRWNPYCLASIGNSKEIDNRVGMGTCDSSNSIWRWDEQQLRNGWNPNCLGSIGNSKEIDNRVVMGSCGQSNAVWRWDGDQIRNGWNPYCLGSIGNSKAVDNPIVMGSCGQSNAQWYIEEIQ